jgi:hypothetical protein
MNTRKPFTLFDDLWDEDDITASITWGLCGRTKRRKSLFAPEAGNRRLETRRQ